jgi:hypothetical protein
VANRISEINYTKFHVSSWPCPTDTSVTNTYTYKCIYINTLLILIMLVEVGVVIKSWAGLYRNWSLFLSRAGIRDRTCSPPSSLLNEHFGPLVRLKCLIHKGHHSSPPGADLKNDVYHALLHG